MRCGSLPLPVSQVGMDIGHAVHALGATSACIEYRGKVMNRAARIAGFASAGQVGADSQSGARKARTQCPYTREAVLQRLLIVAPALCTVQRLSSAGVETDRAACCPAPAPPHIHHTHRCASARACGRRRSPAVCYWTWSGRWWA